MAEEKTKKKKLGIVRRILKWIGLGLLTLLLIAALIFQAPWKVITLLIIILLACTALPRPARKWFWLSTAVVIIALIIWVFLPDDNEGWRPYTFDEELAALEDKYAIPDEENAATIYNKLMESYDANDFDAIYSDPNTFDIIYRNPWLSKDYPEAAAWLQRNQSLIETLMEISKTERCIFPIKDPTNLSQQLDRTAAMRHWAFLLVIAANNDTAEGRIKESLQENITILQMGNHLCQQPATLDLLVSIAVRAIALRQFNRFVISNEPKETHLKSIEQALRNVKHNWSDDLPRILDDEKLIAKQSLAAYYEINPKGKIRLSRDPLKEIRANCRKALQDEEIDNEQIKAAYERIAYPSYLQKKLIRAYTVLKWFYIPSSPQKAASIIDAAYERYYTMDEPDFEWQEETRKSSITAILSNYLRYMTEYWVIVSEPLFPRIHELHIRLACDIRGASIIIALRRYKNETGNWPESLEDIKSIAPAEIFVDPFNNSSFVYKLTDNNFELYSKGKNNIDENGQRTGRKFDLKTKQFVGKEKDDWLIWPPRSRKTKE